jgi:regulator of RNase E activity RraB
LNAPPKGEEELPNLNKNPAQQQQEDGGPLQEVVRAGEGGGPDGLPLLFHQGAGHDVEVHGGATSTGHQFGFNLHETNEQQVFRQGKHIVCIQNIIVLLLFLSTIS